MPQLIASVEGVEIKHIYLKNDRTTLGRRPYNDIVFDNLVVSGEHCVFELKGIADVYLRDLGSTNGTYLNGHMVKARELLHDNDIINIGHFKIQYLATSAHEEPAESQETTAMSLDAIGLPGTAGARQASLKVLSGSSAGLEVRGQGGHHLRPAGRGGGVDLAPARRLLRGAYGRGYAVHPQRQGHRPQGHTAVTQ